MKKILFISRFEESVEKQNSNGVIRKLKLEIETLCLLGYSVDYVFFKEDYIYIRKATGELSLLCKSLGKHYHLMKEMYACLKHHDIEYDYLYCRYDHVSYNMISFFSFIRKKYKTRIIAELPTYSKKWEPGSSLRTIIGFIIKRLMNLYLKLPIDVFLTFSDHNEIFGIPAVQIENFFDTSTVPIKAHTYNDCIHLIGVAMMTPSHGYDRVIWGMYDYYSQPNKKEIYFDIVGEGPAKEELVKLVEKLGLQHYVRFHGIKGGNDLNVLFDNASIAIASLAIFRKRCEKASELKIREYCARGIPFIYSANEPILEGCNFALKISHDESHVDINSILCFLDSSSIDPEQMRSFAFQNCSCESQFRKLQNLGILK